MVASLLAACPIASAQEADTAGAGADPAVAAIRFYQQYLSSLRHAHCRFTPSCSEYAAQAIERYGVVEGSALAADRLMRCNISAARVHPRGADGLLEDPLEGDPLSTSARVPAWMFIPPEPSDPPLPPRLESGRMDRIEETVAFARRLCERGDCERAATEYQRIGSLADLPATDAWAFARIGECQLMISQWTAAERAFLTAGMLSSTAEGHARAVYRAAVSRFDAGSFTACERLLGDPSLASPSDTSRDSAPVAASLDTASGAAAVPPDRVPALGGLCAMARGDWTAASAGFSRGATMSRDATSRTRILGWVPFAEQGPGLSHRSPGLAGTLSAVVPGTGQMYCGRTRDGFRHLIFNGVLIWSVVSLATRRHVPAAILVAGIELPFYLGNIKGASRAAREHDRLERMDLLQRAIRSSTQ
ncbi:MAG: membrane protein insertion efficiency factor YidD [Candidatus Eisenbacteria bacterium]